MTTAATKMMLRKLGSTRTAATSTVRRTFAAAAGGDEEVISLIPTALNEFHKELGGDMVPFAGYELPVLYKGRENGGVMKEHLWCRSEGKSSLFDVSHMGQLKFYGKDAAKFLERVVVGDIQGLKEGQSCLSLITNENGGIIDDTVITNAGDHIYMVVNGATKAGDWDHLGDQETKYIIERFKKGVEPVEPDLMIETYGDTYQLLALQGPGAATAIQALLPSGFDLKNMPFMTGTETTLDGIENCRITRCGYTGEDGFEISMPREHAVSMAAKLLEDPTVNPTGLGARDSLRLEAGLCLYGHDLDGTTTPTMAALGWTMGRPGSRRRTEGGFIGSEHILTPEGKFKKVPKKRVGIIGMKAPAREHTEIFDATGETKIGEVTSGTFAPSLKKPIAMGYVETPFSKADTDIMLKIRNKMQPAKITKMPFVESRYYSVP